MPKTKDVHGVTERHHAYRLLREILIIRRIPAGQPLREPEWVRRLGVNRTALREALARLCSEGLVVEGEKCGYRVPSYTPQEVEDIRECRQMVEAVAVERIIRNRRNRTEHLKRLRELCDELDWILARGYSIEIAEADNLFHEALVRLSGNQRLILLHRCLPQTMNSDSSADARHRAIQARQVLQGHRAIVDAIQKGLVGPTTDLLYGHDDYPQTETDQESESAMMALAQ